ncbi:MAG: hypothetical protein K2M11_05155 [Paramuribaculum sp.]|nr:hypothetical protein [Paramuribaculum sp.]
MSKSTNTRATFLQVMRYASVFSITAVLLLFAFVAAVNDDAGFFISWCLVLLAVVFYIIIPIIGFWIYSFIESIRHNTKTDKMLLYFQIADLLLIGFVAYKCNLYEPDCNAVIMAKHYDAKGSEIYRQARIPC